MSAASALEQLISVDWGTSNLRASLVDPQGTIVDQIESDQGLLSKPTDFAACLRSFIQPWLERSHAPEPFSAAWWAAPAVG